MASIITEGKPVLLRGLAADWPAVQLWSAEYFGTQESLGHIPVLVSCAAAGLC
jgi:hypothetical protein